MSFVARSTSPLNALFMSIEPAESETLPMTIDGVQTDELDVAGTLSGSNCLQDFLQWDAGPFPRADRLWSPGKLSRHRPQRQKLGPPEACTDERRGDVSLVKGGRELFEGETPRAINQPANLESPGMWIDFGDGCMTAGKEAIDGSDVLVGGNGPNARIETLRIVGTSLAGHCHRTGAPWVSGIGTQKVADRVRRRSLENVTPEFAAGRAPSYVHRA